MTEHEDETRRPADAEEETGARGGEESRDADALPGAPGSDDTALGDTDQHSRVPSHEP